MPGHESFERLPKNVKRWLYYERNLLDRRLDSSRMVSLSSDLPTEYLPERLGIYRLGNYWVPKNAVRRFEADSISTFVHDEFSRTEAGRRQVRYFVHPAAIRRYSDALRSIGATPAQDSFWGVATSSERTYLVWKEGQEDKPFCVKLSLPYEVGGNFRTLSAVMTSRCVGISQILEGSSSTLPRDFGCLREVLGIAPRAEMPDNHLGGFIVREIPGAVISGRTSMIPMFALYAPRPGRPPLIAVMARKCRLPLEEFILRRICRAYAVHWLRLVIDSGMVPESHAQNLLLETDGDLLPTGRFIHRDLEGFFVEIAYRRKMGLYLPESLPRVCGIRRNYAQQPSRRRKRLKSSIRTYFQGGVLYNLDRLMRTQGRSARRGTFRYGVESEFVKELVRALRRRSGIRLDARSVHLYDELVDAIIEVRSRRIAAARAASSP